MARLIEPVPRPSATRLDVVLGSLAGRAGAGDAPLVPPFRTGLDPLDETLRGGFRSQDLVLLGGKPGVGKTMVAVQWARAMALDGADVIYACYEHSPRLLAARLLMMEVGSIASGSGLRDVEQIPRHLADCAAGWATLEDVPDSRGMLSDALACMRTYAGRLWLVPASSDVTGVAELRELVKRHGSDRTAVFVDYLQKIVPSSGGGEPNAHMAAAACDLKDLALTSNALVVAIAASTSAGLTETRLRPHHLRSASALAYEADVIIMLNEKVDAVSRVHLAYDPVKAETFRDYLVMSIEKNRNGPAGADLEFEKDFAYARLLAAGGHVAQRLVDGRVDAR
ncbi:MAG TPA: DnaB-like helicase C-terminal domain-containing protein [Acidimicrobiia bacterium]|nr:DnaB-like helicase C-terminal domain-containing protein [Acidimicrobiia bacterium]